MSYKNIYKSLGTALYLGLIALEAYHALALSQVPWPGYTLESNNAIYLLLALWAFGAVALWVDRQWLFPFLVFGPFAGAAHAVLLGVGGSSWALPVFADSALLALFTFRSQSSRPVLLHENAPQPGGTKEPSHRAA